MYLHFLGMLIYNEPIRIGHMKTTGGQIMKKLIGVAAFFAGLSALALFAFYFFKLNPQYLEACKRTRHAACCCCDDEEI